MIRPIDETNFDAFGAYLDDHLQDNGRAHPERCTAHRALLGMGAHRDHRGQGIGKALVSLAIAWAIADTALEWIDLSFLAGNIPAQGLYTSVGFHQVATVDDMYRVDGKSIGNTLMTLRLRHRPGGSLATPQI